MARNGSGGVGRGFDSTGPGAMQPGADDGSYFAGAAITVQRPSVDLEAASLLLVPAANGLANGCSSTSSTGLAVPSSTMVSNFTNWSAVGDAVNSRPDTEDSSADARTIGRPRLDSEHLSAGPPTRPGNDRQGSNASLIVLRKTVADFQFGEVLGEGSYSTVSGRS